MELTAFHQLLVAFTPVFSQPSLQSFSFLLEGWIVAGMRAMTSTALAEQGRFPKHFTSYYRFFSQASWSSDAVGTALLGLVLPYAPDGPVVAAVDDTLAQKSGKHVWGANVQHDPLGFMPNALCFGHNWVVLAIIIRVPCVKRDVAVPVFWRLYRSRKARKGKTNSNKREGKTTGNTTAKEHRTRPQLAVEMLEVLREALGKERSIVVVGDSAYGGKSITRCLPALTTCISRLPMKAALYAQPPARRQGQNGRPRKKGERLPSPEHMAADSRGWHKTTVHLYGKKVTVRYKTCEALWFNSAGDMPLRIVVVRDPKGRRKDDAFFSTDHEMPVERILEIYAQRWSIEVAFRDAKQQLGFERPQARTRKAVERTGPFAFVAYGITVAWFCQYGHHDYPAFPVMPWYQHKRAPSFADMQAMLRAQILNEGFSNTPVDMSLCENSSGANTGLEKQAA